MGRKFKCDLSSSSSCDITSRSLSSVINCCNKYPKCKCSPIYYPNKCSPYPCDPCKPNCYNPISCIPNIQGVYPAYPCPPPPNPCVPPPNTCTPSYTVNTTINTSSVALAVTSPTVNVFNMSTESQIITLPSISSLSSCKYTKQFVIANQVGATNSFTIIQTSPDILTSAPISLSAGQTVTLYAVYVPNGTSFWVAQG